MRTRRFQQYVAGLAGLALLLAVGAFAGTYGNHDAINVAEPTWTGSGPMVPNPVTSTINVGEAGTVQPGSVSVTLFDVTSEWPDDLDLWVSNPGGTKVILWSDAGGDNLSGARPARPNDPIVNPTDVTFSDAASNSLPDATLITQGAYKPTNYAGDPGDFFCGDVDPAGTGFMSMLAAFDNQAVQGDWVLTAQDDCIGNVTNISGGWRLAVNNPTAVRVRGLTAAAGRRGAVVRWSTGNEAAVLGYNVYRATSGKAVKINRSLIRAKAAGLARGAAYRVVDLGFKSRASVTYRLQIVDLNGSRTWAGFVSLGRF